MSEHEIDVHLGRYVPLAKAMGIRLRYHNATGLALAAPLTPNTNDKGTAFAGALASIATLSGWALTYMALREHREEAILVITDSAIHYLRPVQEEIVAVCAVPGSEALERFVSSYRKHGKARWELEAAISADGETAVKFRGRYAASRPS